MNKNRKCNSGNIPDVSAISDILKESAKNVFKEHHTVLLVFLKLMCNVMLSSEKRKCNDKDKEMGFFFHINLQPQLN